MPTKLRVGSYVRVITPNHDWYEKEGHIVNIDIGHSYSYLVTLNDLSTDRRAFKAWELMEIDSDTNSYPDTDPF